MKPIWTRWDAMQALQAIQSETAPIQKHTDPKAIQECWKTVWEWLKTTGHFERSLADFPIGAIVGQTQVPVLDKMYLFRGYDSDTGAITITPLKYADYKIEGSDSNDFLKPKGR